MTSGFSYTYPKSVRYVVHSSAGTDEVEQVPCEHEFVTVAKNSKSRTKVCLKCGEGMIEYYNVVGPADYGLRTTVVWSGNFSGSATWTP